MGYRLDGWDVMVCSPLQSFACYLLHAGFLLGSFFNPEDEGNMFLRNVS
jgi:hypothetical protein